MKYIELRNKKYKTADDVPYNIARRFKAIQQKFSSPDADGDLDEELIKLLAQNILPTLVIDYTTMSVDDKELTFGEMKRLVIALRDQFTNIITTQLESAVKSSADNTANNIGAKAIKNGEKVMEA